MIPHRHENESHKAPPPPPPAGIKVEVGCSHGAKIAGFMPCSRTFGPPFSLSTSPFSRDASATGFYLALKAI